tara:strand:- start:2468 stop:2626 length:159 start_codon:yes stop_codon:yes gene_type:complete
MERALRRMFGGGRCGIQRRRQRGWCWFWEEIFELWVRGIDALGLDGEESVER